ncbi:MAG: ABC transporter permease [Candidatus Zixiibacteriota bacterium]
MSGIWTIFLKETRDILRDRRSVVSMVLVPIVFYPIVSIGLGSLISSQVERTRADRQPVGILAAANDPLLESLSKQEKIEIVPVDTLRIAMLSTVGEGVTYDEADISTLFDGRFAEIPDSTRHSIYYNAISSERVRAIVEIPAPAESDSSMHPPITLYTDGEDLKSEVTGSHIETWLSEVRDSIVLERLAALGVDPTILTPFDWSTTNVAPPQKQSGKMLALFLPYFLIILTMSGGMYPALDITAGEKERQTLETLLVAPVRRVDIAIGKFLTVFLAGLVSMILATTSMTVFSSFGAASFGEEASTMPFGLATDTVIWIALLMIPTAMLFASMLVAVSISARSFKEGQSYVTPLLLLVIIPAMITFIPGIELTWPLAVVPVVNLCLAMKEVLLGTYHAPHIIAVFATTGLYAAFMLFVTARIFERESVLFRT